VQLLANGRPANQRANLDNFSVGIGNQITSKNVHIAPVKNPEYSTEKLQQVSKHGRSF